MKNLLAILILLATYLCTSAQAAELSVSESMAAAGSASFANGTLPVSTAKVFGENFFRGKFATSSLPSYDPNYLISIGDKVSVRFWGALDFQADLSVDPQGNIFIPQIGNISIAGLPHERLLPTIESAVRKRYNDNLYVYATLLTYQPVSVFVTGNVLRPGLYEGMCSDSILQFLDKAGGIDSRSGSYRRVRIVRNNQDLRQIDLYAFLTDGRVKTFQFQTGDAIVVDNKMFQISVRGDVIRPFTFEFLDNSLAASEVLKLALPMPTATNFSLTSWHSDNTRKTQIYKISEASTVFVSNGDLLTIESDHSSITTQVTVTGEHEGLHTFQLDKDSSLAELLTKTTVTPFSQLTAIQVFRKSVALQQKELLEAKLRELETLVLTSGSTSPSEAAMRGQESKMILEFIERAHKVEPKGQIVLSGTNPTDFILEDEDIVYIPRKSSIVLVQGEVAFPGAHTWSERKKAIDYIALAGDFNSRANKDNILIVRQTGQIIKSNARHIEILPGDAILVMPKLDGKFMIFSKDLTQILYQIAVAARVMLTL